MLRLHKIKICLLLFLDVFFCMGDVCFGFSKMEPHHIRMQTLGRIFPRRFILRCNDIQWHARSPGLTAPYSLLRVFVKSEVSETCLITILELK